MNRRAVSHGHIHDFAHFFGMDAAETAAKHGEILAEDVDETAVYGSPTRHNAVAQDTLLIHAKVMLAMRNKNIHFAK